MAGGPIRSRVSALARRLGAWPPMLRDLGAASIALWSVCLGEVLMLVLPSHGEVLLALPGVLLAWWLLGGASAAFALLVAALAVGMVAAARPSGLHGVSAHEALTFLAMALALVTLCFAAQAWARGRERRAALLLDACADDAVRRIAAAEAAAAAARARLDAAEAELSQARLAARSTAGRGAALSRDGGFEEARRSEGGI